MDFNEQRAEDEIENIIDAIASLQEFSDLAIRALEGIQGVHNALPGAEHTLSAPEYDRLMDMVYEWRLGF